MGRVIRIDDREKQPVRDSLRPIFEDGDNVDDVTVERMKSGDIVCRGLSAAIERKEISDFLSSVGNKRLWRQKDEMDQMYDYRCLIVEGTEIRPFVADIYGGYSHAIKMCLGTCAWLNVQDSWSAFWVQSDGHEGQRLLAYYALAWFRQIKKLKD